MCDNTCTMDYVSQNDIYEIRIGSLITNVDKDVLVELYQPLVGADAIMLYLTLQKQAKNGDKDELFTVKQLSTITGYNTEMILCDKHLLEAVGLLRTYEKTSEQGRFYIFVLFAPKTPKDFFDDDLFKGLLFKSIGEKEVNKLTKRYQVNLEIPDDFQEISASFVDVYHPDYDDPAFRKNIKGTVLGHESGRVVIDFSYDKFFDCLSKKSDMTNRLFTKNDMKRISTIAALHNITEDTMSSIIIGQYDSSSIKHFDFDRIAKEASEANRYRTFEINNLNKSQIKGSGEIADEIRTIDNCAPVLYLQKLQNGTKPARADVKIVEDLSKEYGFNYGVINAIVKYCLERNDNILKRNYVEKVAASIARKNIMTSIDTINYLYRVSVPSNEKSKMNFKNESNSSTSKAKEIVSNEEINEILNMLDSKKKGGK